MSLKRNAGVSYLPFSLVGRGAAGSFLELLLVTYGIWRQNKGETERIITGVRSRGTSRWRVPIATTMV